MISSTALSRASAGDMVTWPPSPGMGFGPAGVGTSALTPSPVPGPMTPMGASATGVAGPDLDALVGFEIGNGRRIGVKVVDDVEPAQPDRLPQGRDREGPWVIGHRDLVPRRRGGDRQHGCDRLGAACFARGRRRSRRRWWGSRRTTERANPQACLRAPPARSERWSRRCRLRAPNRVIWPLQSSLDLSRRTASAGAKESAGRSLSQSRAWWSSVLAPTHTVLIHFFASAASAVE